MGQVITRLTGDCSYDGKSLRRRINVTLLEGHVATSKTKTAAVDTYVTKHRKAQRGD